MQPGVGDGYFLIISPITVRDGGYGIGDVSVQRNTHMRIVGGRPYFPSTLRDQGVEEYLEELRHEIYLYHRSLCEQGDDSSGTNNTDSP